MTYPTLSSRRNPWSDLLSLQDEMNRLFESTLGAGSQRNSSLFGTDYVPPVDVLRANDSILVRVDLPGMSKDDLDLTVVNNRLIIRGEKKHEKEEGKQVHRVERFYGSFERVIDLPSPIDSESIKASFRDGVLEVTCPLREEAKPRQIAVNVE